MECGGCGAANEAGRKFCGECGAALAVACPACGVLNSSGTKFCGECGGSLVGDVLRPASATRPTSVEEPTAERRLVSVLFVDLVGFTTLSETRDPEEVRELLGQYFQAATRVIGTYGGTVEKFIGDAVMAVWGAPTAHEDDAERAVRAALDLVDAVRRLGEETATALHLRAGVLTGEAAVTLGARNQGMVAGDLVNTASRLQSVAPPGTVLVGERTYRAASGAISFEAAGEQTVKGRETPLKVYRAMRVVARRGGAGRSEQLEGPFVGRSGELRMLKDFHIATAAERRPRLVSVLGQGGIGKSRLVWEFQKYLDGLTEILYWHQGRSPAYGEGVSFWALAEMVRSRAGITESEDPEQARSKLAATVAQWVTEPEERQWIQPRLMHLLGLEPVGAEQTERESLFAAWRVFFERIAEQGVVVMVFEDLQWADSGLLDFLEHVMDWTRDRPIYLITLSRPELLDHRVEWGVGRRSFTSLVLDPLDDEAMRELLTGLVPGLPESAARHILERAEGVPLYAVETVRMLLSEGRVTGVDGVYRPVGDLTDLSVPASLHGLIAARLDGLDPADRKLLQAAAVLGKTFQVDALAALLDRPSAEIQTRLRALVRRELLYLEADPRSPEKGQFSFVQGLIREVAYSTLARRDRRSLHLAAADSIEALDDDGLAGALADHYVAAYRAQPDDADSSLVAAKALTALQAAARRAQSLGSFAQAMQFLRLALEVTTDPSEERKIQAAAGSAAMHAGLAAEAIPHQQRALDLARELGNPPQALKELVRLAGGLGLAGQVKESIELLESAREDYPDLVETKEYVLCSSELARMHMLHGNAKAALDIVDETLPRAERLELTPVVLELLITRGPVLGSLGRLTEATVALIGAISVSSQHDLVMPALRARVNLSYVTAANDVRLSYETAREGLQIARRLGYRSHGFYLLGNASEGAIRFGDWDWALAENEEAVASLDTDYTAVCRRSQVRGMRGEDVDDDMRVVEEMARGISEVQVQSTIDEIRAEVALAVGDYGEAQRLARAAYEVNLAPDSPALPVAGRAAAWLGDAAELRVVVAALRKQPGRLPAATRREMEGALAVLEGRRAEGRAVMLAALGLWRDLGLDYEVAMCTLDLVTMIGESGPDISEVADEAAAIFERLGAKPLLARLVEVRSGSARAYEGR